MLIDRNKAEFKLSSVSDLWPLHESQTQDNLGFNPLGPVLVDLAGENLSITEDGAEDGLRIILSLLLQRV